MPGKQEIGWRWKRLARAYQRGRGPHRPPNMPPKEPAFGGLHDRGQFDIAERELYTAPSMRMHTELCSFSSHPLSAFLAPPPLRNTFVMGKWEIKMECEWKHRPHCRFLNHASGVEEEGEKKLGTGDEVEVGCYTGLDFQYPVLTTGKMGQFSQPKVNWRPWNLPEFPSMSKEREIRKSLFKGSGETKLMLIVPPLHSMC